MPDSDRQSILEGFALELFEAEKTGRRIDRLSDQLPDLTEPEAYVIAAANIRRRHDPVVGYKLGYTSAAMRKQMNIANPNFGVLTLGRVARPGEPHSSLDGLVHPRVEPELTIQLGRDLRGGGCSAGLVAEAVECVYPSLEIVDTRYRKYVFKAVDNIADNSSSALCVLGAPLSLATAQPLAACAVELLEDERTLATGTGADAMGDPLASVAWLADKLAESGQYLRAGDIVMTGGLTRAFEVRAGQSITARFSRFETLTLRCG